MAEQQFIECYPSPSQLQLSSELLLAIANDSDSDSAIEGLHVPTS